MTSAVQPSEHSAVVSEDPDLGDVPVTGGEHVVDARVTAQLGQLVDGLGVAFPGQGLVDGRGRVPVPQRRGGNASNKSRSRSASS